MIVLILLILLGVQLFLLVNLQFTAWPEMLSYPYLHNEGFLLYKDMIHPYPPLLTMFLSLAYKVFGYNLLVVKTIAWLIILSSTLLLYFIVNYLTKNKLLALFTTAFYVLFQPFFEGNMLWFDMAIIPPVLLGTYLVLRWVQKEQDNYLFWASFFLSIAALIKQTAGLFLLVLFSYLLVRRVKLVGIAKLFIPPVFLLVPLIIRLIQEKALQDFINWTILYPLGEWGNIPGYVQMFLSGRQMLVIAILTTPILAINIVRRKSFSDPSSLFLMLFLGVSLVMVYPRFSYFHFQLALAFIVLNLSLLAKIWNVKRAALFFGGITLLLVPFVQRPLLATDWQKEARFYGLKDTDLARQIADVTNSRDKVFLFGLHSGLYVLADRLPSKRWTDNFAWYLEIPGVQEEVLSRWEINPPNVIFWRQPDKGNWFDLGAYQPQRIVEYINNHYNFEGELVPGVQTWRRND